MQGRPLEVGDRVTITQSWSSDVVPGDVGIVEGRMLDGYWISITTIFQDAFGKSSLATRGLFFRARDVAPAVDETELIQIGAS